MTLRITNDGFGLPVSVDRPGGARLPEIPLNLTDLHPNDRVYRWWDSGAFGAQIQALTVVRVNRVTVTVRTDAGNTFRLSPADVAGRVDWE